MVAGGPRPRPRVVSKHWAESLGQLGSDPGYVALVGPHYPEPGQHVASKGIERQDVPAPGWNRKVEGPLPRRPQGN